MLIAPHQTPSPKETFRNNICIKHQFGATELLKNPNIPARSNNAKENYITLTPLATHR